LYLEKSIFFQKLNLILFISFSDHTILSEHISDSDHYLAKSKKDDKLK